MENAHLPKERGATILEIVVSMGVVVIGFSGIFLMNSQVLALLRGSLESTASTRVLQDRAEQLRGSTWAQVTDAAYHAGPLLSIPPDSAGALAQLTETVSVTAHLASPGTVTPITVTRDSAATIATLSPGAAQLRTQPSVRVDLTARWLARGGRPRMRQLSLVFGEGGISGKR